MIEKTDPEIDSELKLNDVVQLKSGEQSPKMTITFVSKEAVRCSWFAGKKYCKASLPKNVLKKVVPDDVEPSKPAAVGGIGFAAGIEPPEVQL